MTCSIDLARPGHRVARRRPSGAPEVRTLRSGRPARRVERWAPCQTPGRTLLRIAAASWAAALTLACGSGAGPDAPRAVGQPLAGPLACAAPQLDFGPVHEGQILTAGFDLRVESAEPVTVQAVRADCGCTATELVRAPAGDFGAAEPYTLKTPLSPGDVLRIKARYDTRGKRGREQRDITLYADVPGGRAVVGLVADVQPWLVADRAELILGRIGRGEVREERLQVRSVGGEEFSLRHDRRAVPDQVVLELTPVEPGPEGRATHWDVLVRVGPDVPEGAHQYPLYLVSDYSLGAGEESEAVVASTTPQLLLEAVGLFRLEPRSITFRDVSTEATVAETVRLVCHDDDFELGRPSARLEVAGVADEAGSRAVLETARVDVHPGPGGSWEVQVLLEGLAPEVGSRFLALVIVETGHPDQPRIEIPVLGFRARGEGYAPAGPVGSATGPALGPASDPVDEQGSNQESSQSSLTNPSLETQARVPGELEGRVAAATYPHDGPAPGPPTPVTLVGPFGPALSSARLRTGPPHSGTPGTTHFER